MIFGAALGGSGIALGMGSVVRVPSVGAVGATVFSGIFSVSGVGFAGAAACAWAFSGFAGCSVRAALFKLVSASGCCAFSLIRFRCSFASSLLACSSLGFVFFVPAALSAPVASPPPPVGTAVDAASYATVLGVLLRRILS